MSFGAEHERRQQWLLSEVSTYTGEKTLRELSSDKCEQRRLMGISVFITQIEKLPETDARELNIILFSKCVIFGGLSSLDVSTKQETFQQCAPPSATSWLHTCHNSASIHLLHLNYSFPEVSCWKPCTSEGWKSQRQGKVPEAEAGEFPIARHEGWGQWTRWLDFQHSGLMVAWLPPKW